MERMMLELMRVDTPGSDINPDWYVIGDVVRVFEGSPQEFAANQAFMPGKAYMMVNGTPDGTTAIAASRLQRSFDRNSDPPGIEYIRMTQLAIDEWPQSDSNAVLDSPFIWRGAWQVFQNLLVYKKDEDRLLTIATLFAEPL